MHVGDVDVTSVLRRPVRLIAGSPDEDTDGKRNLPCLLIGKYVGGDIGVGLVDVDVGVFLVDGIALALLLV